MPSYGGGARKFGGHNLNKLDELFFIKREHSDAASCRKIGLKYIEMAESKVLLKLLDVAYQRLGPEEQKAFDVRVHEVTSQFGSRPSKALAGSAGLLVIGNLGGFATYTLMSTVLSGISFGTLSFGAYTMASSVLSVALGPVGWLGLGAAGIYALGKPTLKKTVPLVASIAMIRQRLKSTGLEAA